MRSRSEQVSALMSLFVSPPNRKGVFNPAGGMSTVKETITESDWLFHLEGTVGLGIVPIQEDGTTTWAAIDVDAHEEDGYVDMQEVALAVEAESLPLVVCRSKSAGAHLYLFLERPAPAAKVVALLHGFAQKLAPVLVVRSIAASGAVVGKALTEFFPKQKKLTPDMVGNWLNMPYFNARDTGRYAWSGGQRLSLDEFLDAAERARVQKPKVTVDSGEAPPCVQAMLSSGIPAGCRNLGLFAIGTFFKKSDQDDVEGKLFALNYDPAIVEKPLAKQEVAGIARSVTKGKYNYRCNEEPCAGLCDKDTCRTRKYGVGDGGPTKHYDTAEVGAFTKVLSDPPRWIVEINGVEMELNTDQLYDHKAVRKAALEKACVVMPPMKQEDWLQVVRVKNETRKELSAPNDSNRGAMIVGILHDFVKPAARMNGDGRPHYGKLSDLARGLPVAYNDPYTKQDCILFRGADFISALKRKRAEEFKGAELWSVLRKAGCFHDKLRVGPQVLQVWGIAFENNEIVFEIPEMKEKF